MGYLSSQPIITTEMGKKLAHSIDATKYLKSSSKEGKKINKIFEEALWASRWHQSSWILPQPRKTAFFLSIALFSDKENYSLYEQRIFWMISLDLGSHHTKLSGALPGFR